MKRHFLSFALIVLVGSLIGCGKGEPDEIRIGVITPLTGEGATYGDATQKGLDLALDEINARGGVLGKKVSLVYEDDKMNAATATGAIQKLISVDKTPVIIGAFGSSISLAIAPIAEQNKVVLFSASSTADALKNAGDYFFRNVPTNSTQGKSAAEFVLNKLRMKNAAIFFMNNDYGISLSHSFAETFTKLGGNILIREQYQPDQKDFRSQLSKIKAKHPQVIFYPGHYVPSALILRQAKELGIKATFVGGDGSYSPELITNSGGAAEGSYYTLMALGYGVADSLISDYESAFERKYGQKSDVYAAYAYDALMIIVDAIRRGGYTSEGIKDALYKTRDFKGITGITNFDKNGEVDKPFYIYEVQNSSFELVK